MLKLSLVGADRRTYKMLQLFFSGPGKGIAQLVGETDADADIVNVAGFKGDMVWQKHRATHKRPAIIISVDEKRYPGAIWVPKPIQKSDFIRALSDISERVERAPTNGPTTPVIARKSALSSAEKFSASEYSHAAGRALVDYKHEYLCGEHSDALYLDPMYRSRLFYHPEHTLQHAVSRAVTFGKESGANISLKGLPEPIIVFSSGKLAYSPWSVDGLRGISRQELSGEQLALKSVSADFMVNEGDRRVKRSDCFLWEVSLLSSRGRVPYGTDLSARVGLKEWPNLTRFSLIPHAMQLAALWHVEPSNLNDTAEKLGIRYRYVYAFYSACLALDLIVINPDEDDLVAKHDLTVPEQGFVSRLVGYLKRNLS